MLAEIAAVASTLKALGDTAKTVKDLSSREAIKEKIGELLDQIATANERALAAHARETALLERVKQLEGEKLALEDWTTEKQRYKLTDFGGGTFAQTVKPGMEGDETPHRLCNPCFQERRKGYLHSKGDFNGREKVVCDACDKTFMLGVGRPPQVHTTNPNRRTRYSPFR